MILPIVAIGLIFGVVFTFTDLSVVYLLTNGGPVGATSVLTLGVATDLIRGDIFFWGEIMAGALIPAFRWRSPTTRFWIVSSRG